jgi:hypothetical protein
VRSNNQFSRLSEPDHIGSVRTRNRIIKSGAGMLLWYEDELHMNARVMAFYEAIARSGVTPGEEMVGLLQVSFFSWLRKKGATIISGVKSMEITKRGINYISGENLKRTLEVDTVLPVSPLKPNDALLEEIKGLVPEVYTIGIVTSRA